MDADSIEALSPPPHCVRLVHVAPLTLLVYLSVRISAALLILLQQHPNTSSLLTPHSTSTRSLYSHSFPVHRFSVYTNLTVALLEALTPFHRIAHNHRRIQSILTNIMRFCTVAVAAIAAAPAMVSAATGTMGFALGTKMGSGECKSQQDYEADFDAIKSGSGSTVVRGYSASDCNMAKNALPAAKSKGFKVVLGIWCVDSIDGGKIRLTEHL